METLGIYVGSVLMLGLVILAILILRKQKQLDAPYGGLLVVEKQSEGMPLVYFQAIKDPGTFTDGQELKLKIRVLE